MSRRTAEANKAIRLAWEREQELVREGKGTRDWTEEQQKDILDPDKGKAYDDKGRAFEGQHMRSVAEYPEYQGNPANIQFLTKDEHLEAHKGSWQNPTNWYYDPMTKEFTDFGDGEIIPCKVTNLSDPIISLTVTDAEKEIVDKSQEVVNEDQGTSEDYSSSDNKQSRTSNRAGNKADIPKPSVKPKASSHHGGFAKGLKAIGGFIVNHPVESIEIAVVAVGGVAKIVSSVRNGGNGTNAGKSSSETTEPSVASKIADIIEKANRTSPSENDVSGHRQRYHTKDGVVWREKAPYHRGGKDN